MPCALWNPGGRCDGLARGDADRPGRASRLLARVRDQPGDRRSRPSFDPAGTEDHGRRGTARLGDASCPPRRSRNRRHERTPGGRIRTVERVPEYHPSPAAGRPRARRRVDPGLASDAQHREAARARPRRRRPEGGEPPLSDMRETGQVDGEDGSLPLRSVPAALPALSRRRGERIAPPVTGVVRTPRRFKAPSEQAAQATGAGILTPRGLRTASIPRPGIRNRRSSDWTTNDSVTVIARKIAVTIAKISNTSPANPWCCAV